MNWIEKNDLERLQEKIVTSKNSNSFAPEQDTYWAAHSDENCIQEYSFANISDLKEKIINSYCNDIDAEIAGQIAKLAFKYKKKKRCEIQEEPSLVSDYIYEF